MISSPKTPRAFIILEKLVRQLSYHRRVYVATARPAELATDICTFLPGTLCDIHELGLTVWRAKGTDYGED